MEPGKARVRGWQGPQEGYNAIESIFYSSCFPQRNLPLFSGDQLYL